MQYIINGGKPLSGTIDVAGAKNVALKLIVAALLLKGKSTLTNVPRIRDVVALVDIINTLGGHAVFTDEHTLEVENTLTTHVVPLELAVRIRVSFLLMVPLLHTFRKAQVPNPGGCRLGARPVDRLVESITTFGGSISYSSEDGYYYAHVEEAFTPGEYTFAKPSHTGTEFALMNMSRIQGKSVIHNAAHEPEIDELITFLNAAGAHIVREGNDIVVEGNDALQGVEQRVGSDRNEVISFIVLSALCKGSIIINNVSLKPIQTFLDYCKRVGITYTESNGTFQLQVAKTISSSDIVTAPHPGFMTDWQPLWAVLMTQAQGDSTIHETVFEQRFNYVQELNKHGAQIEFFDPTITDPSGTYQFAVPPGTTPVNQAIRIHGPTQLHNAATVITDMRAGACLLFAGLISSGKSVISGAEQIERGYEDLIERLQKLGADVRSIEE
ncbi:MAG: UDP-N-acetylglucosamine 1-carboxyvinyltransferase [Candidatus Roizmanbacteria bacterium]|nr:UDP-N-acetylglucosamine 1-carboxyvinyltransferase [Candidatus Roizmanbacteria bacterium]